jgi:hypothetical protein
MVAIMKLFSSGVRVNEKETLFGSGGTSGLSYGGYSPAFILFSLFAPGYLVVKVH